jgi:hypothetical protein
MGYAENIMAAVAFRKDSSATGINGDQSINWIYSAGPVYVY